MPLQFPPGKRPVFIGSAHSLMRRYMGGSISSRANEIALEAIADAGLKVEDIDGLFCTGSPNGGRLGAGARSETLDMPHMQQVINWKNIRYWIESAHGAAPGSTRSATTAALALASGACNYALLFRTTVHPAGERYHQISRKTAGGNAAFSGPYGHGVGGAMQAVTYQRYLSKYGAKREEMWGYVGNAHKNAELNPYSVWKGRPITFEDYMNARLIAYPMNVFDNDMPCDGIGVLVMTTEDRAKDTPHPGGYLAGMSSVPYHIARSGVIESLESEYERGEAMARNVWESSGFKPSEMDLIHVYDGFSPMVWMWLEIFGFAPKGEAHNWCQAENIDLQTGKQPLNTSGGNLGNGRLHGWTHIHETAMQMMGTAGERQLKKLDLAFCQTGPMGDGCAAVFTRE